MHIASQVFLTHYPSSIFHLGPNDSAWQTANAGTKAALFFAATETVITKHQRDKTSCMLSYTGEFSAAFSSSEGDS